jgi:acyl-CoA reductase-like NAD-dependent aldehyde dehydrogenase
MKFAIYTLSAFFLLFLFFPSSADAQRRDYLTEEEIELVRDAQEIDRRIDVLTKAIDRRFMALSGNAEQTKQLEKDAEKWGELPKGKRIQLLSDIHKILQKAADDIDDLARRDGGIKSELFPKAVHKLADAAQRFLPQLRTQMDAVTDEKERGSILNAIDLCNQIIEAATKVPKEYPKEKKKKSKN